MHKNVRLPIAYHVIGHPVLKTVRCRTRAWFCLTHVEHLRRASKPWSRS